MTLAVTSSASWTVSASDESWMTVEKSGTNAIVTLKDVEDGKSYASTLTLTSNGKKYTVKVLLNKPVVNVPSVSLRVSPSSICNTGSIPFKLTITHANTSAFKVEIAGFKFVEEWRKSIGESPSNTWTGDLGDAGQSFSPSNQDYTLTLYPEAGAAVGSHTITVTVTGNTGTTKTASIQIAVTEGGYNAANAVAYAQKWGGSKRNPAYNNYTGSGGDCANFVSQCLHEGGGLPTDSTWEPYTTTWVGAISLYDYLKKLPGCTVTDISKGTTAYINKLSVGDVIWCVGGEGFSGKDNGHVMIVTKVENGKVYYCGHTSDALDAQISTTGNLIKNMTAYAHFN